eukprot:gene12461-26211_t
MGKTMWNMWLGYGPFKAETRVRVPLSWYIFNAFGASYPKSLKAGIQTVIKNSFAPLGVSLATLLTIPCSMKSSVASADIREQIADTASFLPGFGLPDVYYPSNWEGYWAVNRTITEVIVTQPSLSFVINMKQSQEQNNPLIYDEHFVQYKDHIVSDRAYGLTNYYRTLLSDSNILCNWDISNPNIQSILSVSNRYDIRITKRSVEPESESKTNKKRIFGY